MYEAIGGSESDTLKDGMTHGLQRIVEYYIICSVLKGV
jgi:hypothetical protein